jgi:hypothetical protein
VTHILPFRFHCFHFDVDRIIEMRCQLDWVRHERAEFGPKLRHKDLVMPDSFRNRRPNAVASVFRRFDESSLSDSHSQPIALSHWTEVVTIAFVYFLTRKEPYQLMYVIVIAALAVALVAAVLALVRESRLRRALQKLLKAMLKNWRQHETENDS